MKLQDFLRLTRRWLPLALVLAVGAAAGVYALSKYAIKPLYTAQVVMEVQLGQTSPLSPDPSLSTQQAETEAQKAQEYVNVNGAIRQAQRQPGMRQYASDNTTVRHNVNCAPTALTSLFACSVTAHSPLYAATVANALSSVFKNNEQQAAQQRYQNLITQLRGLESTALKAGNQNLYNSLVNKETDISLAAVQSQNLVRVVAAARVPTSPSSPHLLLNGALAFLAVLVLVFGGAVLADQLDDSLRNEEDLKDSTGLPILSAVPRIRTLKRAAAGPESLVVVHEPRSSVAEAFRLTRTGIAFSRIDNPPQALLVTSTVQAEGKSTVASNLASAFAEGGKSVVLVDLDLRRPCLSKIFDVPESGLTNLLLDDSADVTSYLVPTVVPNLRVLPSGPLPPNPAQLISSRRMSHVIERLRTIADLVILDTPPVLAVTDAVLAGTFSDGAIVVVRPDKVHRRSLQRTVETLKSRGIDVIGLVVNSLSRQGTTPYYSYTYGYGQGYGEDERKAKKIAPVPVSRGENSERAG